jgi:LysR family glycine cleavage system transcriptional activator
MVMPSLNALRTFEAAARLRSFAKAGDEMHVTHAAVSHQIRHLEDWFGFPLFRREGRGVRLTAAGESLSAVLTSSFSSIEKECARLKQRGAHERVTVACIPSIASRWLIPALPLFAWKYPDHDIRVVYASAENRLRETECDVLITLGADPSPRTNSRLLFSRRNRAVASPSYLQSKDGRSGVDFSTVDLLHDETTEHWAKWFRLAAIDRPQPLRGPVFQDFNMLATAMVAGHGVALCPVDVIRREVTAGDLVVLSELSILEDEGYFLITGTNATPAAVTFSDWFCELMQTGITPDAARGQNHALAAPSRSPPE